MERFVEWVVEVAGEWLVETVCKMVVKVVKTVVEAVITVARLVVVGGACLFTDPRGALDALVDFWYDVLDIIRDIGELVTDVLAAAGGLLDITREFVLDLGDRLGPVGRFFLGIIAGALDIARRVIDGIRRTVDGLFGIVAAILGLDFCSAFESLVNGVLFGSLQAAFGATGVLSLGSNGVRDGFARDDLRKWLRAELDERFDHETLAELEDALQMESSSFGIQWPVQPLRCTVSSRSNSLNLARMHEEGELDLFEVAGYAPVGCHATPVKRSVWKLVYKDTDYRVSVGDIRAYLSQNPSAAPEFELIAGDNRVLRDMLTVADRKMRQMAIELEVSPLGRFEIEDEDDFVLRNQDATPLATRVTAELGLDEICDLPSLIVFGYWPRLFGLASVWWLNEFSEYAPTASTVRSSFMQHLFGIVMAHEMGHCFSLTHIRDEYEGMEFRAHDGLENIMFTMDDDAGLTAVTGKSFLEFLTIGGEPRFTLEDGMKAWIWILVRAAGCLPGMAAGSSMRRLKREEQAFE